MPRSMTGFGTARAQGAGVNADWEVKSVNNRYLDVRQKLPAALRHLEADFDRLVRARATRGRVELTLQVAAQDDSLAVPALNLGLAGAMLDQLAELARQRGDVFVPDYSRLEGNTALWREPEQAPESDLARLLLQGLDDALDDWNRSRAQEGDLLKQDLLQRLGTVCAVVERLKELAPRIKELRQQALRDKVEKALADVSLTVAEDRLLTELAVLADRLDVSEELTRLDAHLTRMAQTLAKGGEMGKKLDFLLQETFREITTCGNKCQDAEASRLVVDVKAELEKCREQVQNLE